MRPLLPLVVGALLNSGCGAPLIAFPTPYQKVTTISLKVVGSSANDIWWNACQSGKRDLWHYDGTRWAQVVAPGECSGTEHLFGFQSAGPGAVWLVGVTGQGPGVSRVTTAGVIEHVGTSGQISWSSVGEHLFVVSMPDGGTNTELRQYTRTSLTKAFTPAPPGNLGSIVATSPTDVWQDLGTTFGTPVIANGSHFDGTTWSASMVGPTLGRLNPGFASNDVWALDEDNAGGTVINAWHWDGATWTRTELPSPKRERPGGFHPGRLMKGSDGRLAVFGSWRQISGGVVGAGEQMIYRRTTTGWSEGEAVQTSRVMEGCNGSSCGVSVSGLMQDGTLVLSNAVDDSLSLIAVKP
ncbi:MAG: hypothetical protein Q8L14_06390 [Myxococcales bacterium]|nr:hypothetical protein [Myxococcales bacterium]